MGSGWLFFLAVLVALFLWDKGGLKERLGRSQAPETKVARKEQGGYPMGMGSPIFKALVGDIPSERGEDVISEGSTGVVTAVNTLNVMSDVLTLTVQRGRVAHLRASDFVYANLQSVVPAALPANSPWELLARDPSQRASKVITSGVLGQVLSVTDATLKKYIGRAFDIGPDYQIVFRVNSSVALVVANSDWAISYEVEYASL